MLLFLKEEDEVNKKVLAEKTRYCYVQGDDDNSSPGPPGTSDYAGRDQLHGLVALVSFHLSIIKPEIFSFKIMNILVPQSVWADRMKYREPGGLTTHMILAVLQVEV